MSQLKLRIHASTLSILEGKIFALKKSVADLQRAASEDTKSSAGDKFETSREMMKLEIDKTNLQLSQQTKLYNLLKKIDPKLLKDKVELGSLVISNEGKYYFSVPLGKVLFDGDSCFALSMASPLGKALVGKKTGDKVSFMGREIEIEHIY